MARTMSLKLWLIRHGQSMVNSGVWTDKPHATTLSPLGEETAQAAAAKVIEEPTVIISSPLIRAVDSANYIRKVWPEVASVIWPIEEFIYLSPAKLSVLTKNQRNELISAYWRTADPSYCDAQDTESFKTFISRVENFYTQVSKLQGFVVVVGHGQFFKAFLLGLKFGFSPDKVWMKRYREQELKSAIKNSEIIELYFN